MRWEFLLHSKKKKKKDEGKSWRKGVLNAGGRLTLWLVDLRCLASIGSLDNAFCLGPITRGASRVATLPCS